MKPGFARERVPVLELRLTGCKEGHERSDERLVSTLHGRCQSKAAEGHSMDMPLPGDRNSLAISYEELPGAALLRLSGEVDLDNVAILQDALSVVTSKVRNVIVDCSALQYIDSIGFHALFTVHHQLNMRGGQFVIASLSPGLQKVFDIIKLSKGIRCVASVREALSTLNEGL